MSDRESGKHFRILAQEFTAIQVQVHRAAQGLPPKCWTDIQDKGEEAGRLLYEVLQSGTSAFGEIPDYQREEQPTYWPCRSRDEWNALEIGFKKSDFRFWLMWLSFLSEERPDESGVNMGDAGPVWAYGAHPDCTYFGLSPEEIYQDLSGIRDLEHSRYKYYKLVVANSVKACIYFGAMLGDAKAETLRTKGTADYIKPVILGGPKDPPRVLGKEMKPLSPSKYKTIRALVKAGDEGLTKDALEELGGSSARQNIKDLIDEGNEWAEVLRMPGEKGKGGYRIADRRME